MRLWRKILFLVAPRHPRKREIFYLRRAIRTAGIEIDTIIEQPQPPCCHGCAFPELNELQSKQDRRRDRLRLLLGRQAPKAAIAVDHKRTSEGQR